MKIVVLGAGAWGTAMAMSAAAHAVGHDVTLWARDAQQAAGMQVARSNQRYLPGLAFPPSLRVQAGDARALADQAELVIIGTPMAALRGMLLLLRDCAAPIAWLCKGFEADTGLMAHEVCAEVAPQLASGAFSGPSFAQEVARGQPSALVAASRHARVRDALVAAFHGPALRVYASEDIVGVEVGGAVKNVLGHRHGPVRRPAAGPERARGPDHARPGRDDPPGPGTGCAARYLHGPVGPGRPGADRHG
ncbi:glycerol-3-phosphate dehydrogenase (NAD(P)+) [Alicycliphilus sp. B1]|nr:glycerol-3-phosphate dehydrogenase (NAD(P)+) [Alicycliphilus sp. B1]